MADRINDISTNAIPGISMGQQIDQMVSMSQMHRRNFERRWYDNNFFFDGHHFRYLSRQTGKIVDLSSNANLYMPTRAIPKTSRQLLGVANVLSAPRYTPAVYPEYVDQQQYQDQEAYDQALKEASDLAKKVGCYISEELKQQDFTQVLASLIILSGKHSVSYLKIWPDDSEEKIRMAERDAFDLYTIGDLNELEDAPYVIETQKTLISQIKSNPKFDQEQLKQLTPDNRYASSELKEAYMASRYGKEYNSDSATTLILKEAFIKERLNDTNRERIQASDEGGEILQNTKEGDIVMRHVFSAAGVTLLDEYLKSTKYPYLDLRLSPGQLYQTPLIERFIPANKSLDMIVSRVERYTNTMAVGIYQKRTGEQFHITNQAGGQIIEYDQRPLEQMQVAPLPPFIFELMTYLGGLIEEQGVTTTALGKIPKGVKANAAIESLKESEQQSLAIPAARVQMFVKKVAERLMDIADDYFITPQTVRYMDMGKPQYFQIIGNSALKKRTDAKVAPTNPNLVPIKKDYYVNIEIEGGMGFTKEGQRATMMDLVEKFILPLSEKGVIPPDALKQVVQQVLKTYEYGQTAEFMDYINKNENANLTDEQIAAMKIAVAEVMSDLIKNGILPNQDQRIMEQKVATAEVIKETDLKAQPKAEDKPNTSIPYKDLPPEGRAQMAEQAGITITADEIRNAEQDSARYEMAKTVLSKAQPNKEKDKPASSP